MAFDLGSGRTWIDAGLILALGKGLPAVGSIIGQLDGLASGMGLPSIGALAVVVGAIMNLAK